MQFNPVVLSVEMPVCKIFVTKIQKTGRIWTNGSAGFSVN